MDNNFKYDDKAFEYFGINPDITNVSSATTYPHNPSYTYESYIDVIDFDKERDADLLSGNGFIIQSEKNIKKELKAENGIFSPKFGQTLSDVNPFIDRYKCRCGKLRGRVNNGLRCPECKTICEYVDDNFSYFGWMVLQDPFVILHPAFYKKIESFLGKGQPVQGAKRSKLENILDVSDTIRNATSMSDTLSIEDKPKDEPYFGIGMVEFAERFDEIMTYYLKKRPNRQDYYDDIYTHRDMVFTHSIPVFTTLLRPFEVKDNNMSFEQTNAMYSMMSKLVATINKNKSRMEREPKAKNQALYNLQKKFMELYAELEAILSGKKGDFRCLLGGRYNFSSRSVIVQNPDLRIDQVILPTVALTVLLEQRIKNILHRFYNIQPAEAHAEWYKSTIEPTDRIKGIIQSIIDDYRSKGLPGIPLLINRN